MGLVRVTALRASPFLGICPFGLWDSFETVQLMADQHDHTCFTLHLPHRHGFVWPPGLSAEPGHCHQSVSACFAQVLLGCSFVGEATLLSSPFPPSTPCCHTRSPTPLSFRSSVQLCSSLTAECKSMPAPRDGEWGWPVLIFLASLWCFKDKERVWTSAQGVQIRQMKRNYCWISAALVLWVLHLSTRTGTRAALAARAELWSLQNPAMNCVGKDAVIQLKQLDFGPLHIQIRDDGKDVHASLKFLRWTLHLERKCNMRWQRWKYQVCPSSWSSIYSII